MDKQNYKVDLRIDGTLGRRFVAAPSLRIAQRIAHERWGRIATTIQTRPA